jgi:TonB-linked SusC/RagA family outer membrane protein
MLSCALLVLASRSARAQRADSTVITGRVTSEGGVVIPLAAVSLIGARLSTTSSEAGTYRLIVRGAVGRSDTLRVLRIGYRAVMKPVTYAAGAMNVDVAMAAQATALEQVVVTGTAGNQERKAQPAVVASIDGADVLAKAPVLGITELITARTTGVSITQGSGTTGSDSRITIRGHASISLANNPLVFIDGIKVASGSRNSPSGVGGQQIDGLSDLNPDDVESIEIVKGPAAATLYGSDATSGVIQIITKRGRQGGRSFSQRVTTEYDNIDPNFTPPTNYYRCAAADVTPTSTSYLCKGQAVGTIVSDNPLVREDAFNNGWTGVLNYAARGSGESFGYFASAGAENEQGTTRNNILNRRTGRVNFNWTASPKMSLEAGVGVSRADVKLPPGDQANQGYLIGAGFGSPKTVVQNADGTISGGWLSATESVKMISAIVNENLTSRLTPNATVRYTPFSWFTNVLTLGGDYVRQSSTTFYPKNDKNWYSATQNTGSVSVSSSDATQYTVQYQGNVNRRFGHADWVSSDLSFGTQWINNVANSVSASGNGLITNDANSVSQTSANRQGGQGYGQNKQFGLFAQEMIGLNDRLFVKLAGRIDKSSAFATNAQTFFLPSYGISYVVSQEPAIQRHLPSFVSTLKLRAAYGETGKSPGSTAALQTYVAAPYLTDLGVLVSGGVAPGNPGNPDLKPERGTEVEAGFDAGFFNDRLGLEATYFAKTTRDLVVSNPLAPSTGFSSSPNVNIGTITNKGLELAARATPIDRRNLTWDVGLNMSTLANTLVSVKNVTPFQDRRCYVAGMSVAAYCNRRIVKVDTTTGVVTVTDSNTILIGGQFPKREGAVNTTLTLFRNLRLYAQADGKFAYRTYDFGREFQDRTAPNSKRGLATKEELGAYAYYRLHPTSTVSQSGTVLALTNSDEDFFEDATFIRFRELSLTWTLPSNVSRRLRVASASLSVGGRNLGLWQPHYLGYNDTEVLALQDRGANGQLFRADLFTLPQVRRLFTRFNVEF